MSEHGTTMTTNLVIIDVQNDFCRGGALAVPDAEAILPVVNGLIREFDQVILTQDWHPTGHVSFASSHPGQLSYDRVAQPYGEQILWPDHCVEDTDGAAFHPGLVLPPDIVIVRKGVHKEVDSYSAFFENDRKTPVGLNTLLQERGVRELVLAGLATDFCVLHTALDARKLGYAVTVLEAGCRGVDIGGSLASAWAKMAEAGVRRG